MVFLGVPAEITVELIRTCTASDDVAPVAAVDQVITITAIDDVPTGKTPEGCTTCTAIEDSAFGYSVPGTFIDLLALDKGTTALFGLNDASTCLPDLPGGKRVVPTKDLPPPRPTDSTTTSSESPHETLCLLEVGLRSLISLSESGI